MIRSFALSQIELQARSFRKLMSSNEEVESAGCDSRFALGREVSDALQEFALLLVEPAQDLEAVYAIIPNSKADTGSTVHPIWDLVSFLYSSSNGIDYKY